MRVHVPQLFSTGEHRTPGCRVTDGAEARWNPPDVMCYKRNCPSGDVSNPFSTTFGTRPPGWPAKVNVMILTTVESGSDQGKLENGVLLRKTKLIE